VKSKLRQTAAKTHLTRAFGEHRSVQIRSLYPGLQTTSKI